MKTLNKRSETILHKRVTRLMGNRFEFIVSSDNETRANLQIDKAILEIKRIENLLTTFSEDSLTNKVNQLAGMAPVKVDQEFFDLVERAIKISEITQGAFDLSYGSIDKRFWNFDVNMDSLPDPVLAKKTVKLINYKNILLDKEELSIFLKEKGMRLGFGGIGKGYAADRARLLMQENGVKNGIVNASGDLCAWGNQPNGDPFTIGIADPDTKRHPFAYLNISNRAIATSGNYEKFAVINGKKYSHTINPKTGFPVSGIKSVTIIAPNAEIADAFATPVMVMGTKVGLDMVNQVKGIECIIIEDNNKILTSENIRL